MKIYRLDEIQKIRLQNAIRAALSIPLIDSIEDFIWEDIFCYAKQVDFIDPLSGIRSKKLFDIVDTQNQIGWSAKALQWNIKIGGEFELVIQRADIFKKRILLGFPSLTINTHPDEIGAALLKHWQIKVEQDAITQNVIDRRVCILIKHKAKNKFAYFEEELAIYEPSELKWHWTDETKTGLQGIRVSDNFCVYRWYPNQKQFFERFRFEDGFVFEVIPKRIGLSDIIDFLNERTQMPPK